MSEIKYPVRYDHSDPLHGHGVWRDAEGGYLFEDVGSGPSVVIHVLTDDELRERNEQIAERLNAFEEMAAKVERAVAFLNKQNLCPGNGYGDHCTRALDGTMLPDQMCEYHKLLESLDREFTGKEK